MVPTPMLANQGFYSSVTHDLESFVLCIEVPHRILEFSALGSGPTKDVRGTNFSPIPL